MKLAFILSTIDKSGPFIVARDIINNIYDHVESIEIFYLKPSNHPLSFKAEYKKISFSETIDLSKFDIVHSHGFLADLYVNFKVRKGNYKLISTLHQKIEPDYRMNYNWLIAKVLEKAWCRFLKKDDAIVTLSKVMVNYYSKYFDSNKLSYLYNGITPTLTANFRTTDNTLLQLANNYTVLGVSANLIYRKGIDQIILALSNPGMSGYAAVIIGDGKEMGNLKALADKYNVAERCLFLGYKENAIDYFKYFDIYLMTSRSEAFGLCVIEAASQKVPVVCSDIDIYREIFNDGEVERFELENTGSLITAIDKTFKNRTLLASKLHEKYIECFTAEKMAKNYLDLYVKLLRGRV